MLRKIRIGLCGLLIVGSTGMAVWAGARLKADSDAPPSHTPAEGGKTDPTAPLPAPEIKASGEVQTASRLGGVGVNSDAGLTGTVVFKNPPPAEAKSKETPLPSPEPASAAPPPPSNNVPPPLPNDPLPQGAKAAGDAPPAPPPPAVPFDPTTDKAGSPPVSPPAVAPAPKEETPGVPSIPPPTPPSPPDFSAKESVKVPAGASFTPGTPLPPPAAVKDPVAPPPSAPVEGGKPANIFRALDDAPPPAASIPVTSPWTLQIKVVGRRTLLEANNGDKVQLRIRCRQLHLQSPNGDIQARGEVELNGVELNGKCELLTIAWQSESILLEGRVQLKCPKDGQDIELTAERLAVKLTGAKAAKLNIKKEEAPPDEFTDGPGK